VIFSITMGDTEASVEKLLHALRSMARRAAADETAAEAEVSLPTGLPAMAMTPREAYYAASRSVSFDQAVGHISAENLIPYPPGIPLVVPGERIEQVHLDYLRYIRSIGGGIVGPEDKTLAAVRVVC